MLKKTKIMTVVGTRPEIIRLSRVLNVLDNSLDHRLVHTGQNYDYELNKIFFDDLGLRSPDFFLEAAEANAACTIARIIERFDALLENETPDAILVLGDTNSCLAAIPAKRRKIPIFHMEAGNRCFDQRVPEETNRRIVDHIADINMPYSDIAREYLLREGIAPDRIIKTGSPMYEVLNFYKDKICASAVLDRFGLQENAYFIASCHREENVDSPANLKNLVDSINTLVNTYSYPLIMSTHPRTRRRLESSGLKLEQGITISKPLGFFDYVHLQQHSALVLSDSGTINEESSILNFPALNIREAHERPEGMEEAAVIMSGLKPDRVLEAARIALLQKRGDERQFRLVADYAMPNVSQKVLRILLSYIDYVNLVVWKKS